MKNSILNKNGKYRDVVEAIFLCLFQSFLKIKIMSKTLEDHIIQVSKYHSVT